jgi:hypothetical protein
VKVKALGKIVIFLIIVGLGIGGFRLYQQMNPPKGGQGQTNGQTQANNPPNNNNTSAPAPDLHGRTIAHIVASSTHTQTLKSLAADFARSQNQYGIEFEPALETRKALQTMLAEGDHMTRRVSGWMASTDVLSRRFADAYYSKYHERVINPDDSDSYRIVASIPLAILTRRGDAERVRQVWESDNPWTALKESGLKWSFASPEDSSSGTLVLAYMLWGYAKTAGMEDEPARAMKGGGVDAFINSMRRNGYVAAQEGSASHTKMFTSGQLGCDFVLNYASTLEGEAKSNSDFTVIYPRKAVFARHTFSVLLTAPRSEQDAARAFAEFISSRYPRSDAPTSIDSIAVPKYYPDLNDLEILWAKGKR